MRWAEAAWQPFKLGCTLHLTVKKMVFISGHQINLLLFRVVVLPTISCRDGDNRRWDAVLWGVAAIWPTIKEMLGNQSETKCLMNWLDTQQQLMGLSPRGWTKGSTIYYNQDCLSVVHHTEETLFNRLLVSFQTSDERHRSWNRRQFFLRLLYYHLKSVTNIKGQRPLSIITHFGWHAWNYGDVIKKESFYFSFGDGRW